jgi:hypothetical protein
MISSDPNEPGPQRRVSNEKRVWPRADESRESGADLVAGAGLEQPSLQPHGEFRIPWGHGVLSFQYCVRGRWPRARQPVQRMRRIGVLQNFAADTERVATLTGDDLKLDNPSRTAGGRTVTVWRRAK